MTGMRNIRLSFVRENVSAVAILLDDAAPATCACIWNLLETPFEGYAVHAMWTGRELSLPIPPDRFPHQEGLLLPPENQTVFPLPGDLVWNSYAPHQWQGVQDPVYDFGIFYGRDSRLFLPMGWKAGNRFGRIAENLEEFAAVAARCQTEGRKMIRIERY